MKNINKQKRKSKIQFQYLEISIQHIYKLFYLIFAKIKITRPKFEESLLPSFIFKYMKVNSKKGRF